MPSLMELTPGLAATGALEGEFVLLAGSLARFGMRHARPMIRLRKVAGMTVADPSAARIGDRVSAERGSEVAADAIEALYSAEGLCRAK